MPMVNCVECGKEISNTAKKCPHCGKQGPVPISRKRKIGCLFLSMALVIVILLILIGIFAEDGTEKKQVDVQPATMPAEIEEKAVDVKLPVEEIVSEAVALLKEARRMEYYRRTDMTYACMIMREMLTQAETIRNAAKQYPPSEIYGLGAAVASLGLCVACSPDAMTFCDRTAQSLLEFRESRKIGTPEEAATTENKVLKNIAGLLGYESFSAWSISEEIENVTKNPNALKELMSQLIIEDGDSDIELSNIIDDYLIFSWVWDGNFRQAAVIKTDKDFYPEGAPIKPGYYAVVGTQSFTKAAGGTAELVCMRRLNIDQ